MNPFVLRMEPASLHELDKFVVFFEESARQLQVPQPVTQELVTLAVEAVTNILKHGYKAEPGFVEVELQREGELLKIFFRDQAKSFDPTQHPPADRSMPLEQRLPGGWGVSLIKRFSDELIHQSLPQSGNELICIRKL